MFPIHFLLIPPPQDVPWACFEIEHPLLVLLSIVLTASRFVPCPRSNPLEVCVGAELFHNMVGENISGTAFCSTSRVGLLLK